MTNLSPAQKRVMDLLSENPGWPYKRLAEELGVGRKTVESHMRAVFEVYNLGSKTEAILEHKRRAELSRPPRRVRRREAASEPLELLG